MLVRRRVQIAATATHSLSGNAIQIFFAGENNGPDPSHLDVEAMCLSLHP
jgi:hypothetical protein